ncbi:MAG: PDDEXK nuclease domain-containing protein, partial [Prevotellaceae bacterium]|nr:PDDEXK nuclease domain-containing protein [Prevotellaceae bacterium]
MNELERDQHFSEDEYVKWSDTVCETIERAKLSSSLKVNSDLLQLYHTTGREIALKQKQQGWGTRAVKRLSVDLQKRYPGESGFSERNLRNMKYFAEEYPDFPFWQVPLAKLHNGEKSSIWQALPAKLKDGAEFVQVPLVQIPWYHHISLLSRVKNTAERLFYMVKAAENAWSRDVMLLQVSNGLYHNYGKAINNFSAVLPPYQSDLAKAIFKDPYKFGFLDINEKANERIIENRLVRQLLDFLLEMGKGFAFVGNQYHLEIDGDDYYIDILMYHTKLHCYVVIELKAVEFIPEFISKLNFYVSAVDDLLKDKNDNPTIGLLLCSDKKNKKVEYT